MHKIWFYLYQREKCRERIKMKNLINQRIILSKQSNSVKKGSKDIRKIVKFSIKFYKIVKFLSKTLIHKTKQLI